ncbi:MAG: hypothetical protein KGJ23_01905 [Euryarchaeota archaeon]|nr:hypothetical protein [Euryarchaeota archaeon]MDE1835349.1 hypothetical protein [Euryarchaeota archaeon]MDE1880756.1 hypothetical protein [Euryarchaeota archaeon]MDE2043645.1 hypothetical protein [Thermoplasmata archaeon]
MATISSTVPAAPTTTAPSGSVSSLARLRRYLQRRPILCLLLLTPGIVEYLSGSSQLSLLMLSPVVFLIFLAANLGLYGPGVLLIREAKVRWKKGWGSVLLLGAAYGILEEGIALSTLFYSYAQPVGSLGIYGHWLGVNWVWTAGLLIVHALWSISLPIMLLELALPETQGKSLLSAKGVRTVLGILVVDVLVLLAFSSTLYHFWAGPVLWVGSLTAILGLAWAAYRAPKDLLQASSLLPRAAPWKFAGVGLSLLPGIYLIEGVSESWRLAPLFPILAVVAFAGVLLCWVLKNVGRTCNQRQLVALGAGLVAVLMPMGLISQLHSGVGILAVLAGDAAAVLFFLHLWRKYSPTLSPAPATAPAPLKVTASG